MSTESILSLQADQALAAANQGPRPKLATTDDLQQARKVAENFEAFFLSQVLQPMFNSLETEGPFGGGNAERVWRGQLVEQYGKEFAQKGGIGIADQVMRELIQAQEAQQP